MPDVRRLAIDGLFEIRPARIEDPRGFFSEVWSRGDLAAAGIDVEFVQDNHSLSIARGVLRGLHFQIAPAAQDKLVRVSRGAVFDVAVDLRPGSASFGRWAGLEISAARWNQVFIPRGFAHGFVTLEANSEVQYKVSAPRRADLERAIRFDDPDIAIDWPVPVEEIQLSEADRRAPFLAAIDMGA